MTNEQLYEEIRKRDEIIAELKAEILELRTEESNDSEALCQAIEIINDCRCEDGTLDFEMISERANYYAEINQYLSIYLLFNDKENDFEADDE